MPTSTKKTPAPKTAAPAPSRAPLGLVRANRGSRPQITFTSDFHELVTGDLVPGPCTLRYDPLRLVTLGDAAQEAHHVRAHIRFHPLRTEWQGLLELPAGLPLADLADTTGQGFMLNTTFTLPEGCDELEVWFSCTQETGETHWDSDYGQNHWLRFGLSDLALDSAKIVPSKTKKSPQDSFEITLTTHPRVEDVKVRWRLTTSSAFPRQISPLVVRGESADRRTWSAPSGGIPVPTGATLAFDLVYTVAGRPHTDDNQGRWYLAH
jgi:hypothetical protein